MWDQVKRAVWGTPYGGLTTASGLGIRTGATAMNGDTDSHFRDVRDEHPNGPHAGGDLHQRPRTPRAEAADQHLPGTRDPRFPFTTGSAERSATPNHAGHPASPSPPSGFKATASRTAPLVRLRNHALRPRGSTDGVYAACSPCGLKRPAVRRPHGEHPRRAARRTTRPGSPLPTPLEPGPHHARPRSNRRGPAPEDRHARYPRHP